MNAQADFGQEATQHAYTFALSEMPGVSFPVIAFDCEEAISTLYTLRVVVLSEQGAMDEALALQSKATLHLRTPEGERFFHGIVSEMHVEVAYPTHSVHVLEIRPPHWMLTQSFSTRVFRELDVEGIVRAVLGRHLSETSDFRIDLTRTYRKRDYVCQYEETDFDFLQRWMESQGLCFFFEHGTNDVCMVVTDDNMRHPVMVPSAVSYRPGSDADHYRRIGTPDALLLSQLRNRMARSPGKVVVRDYHYERPTLDLTREAFTNPGSDDDQAKREGEAFHYGGGQTLPEECENQAKIRAEMHACRRIRYEGTSNAYPMAAGLCVSVQDHPTPAFNRAYLLVSIRHEGAQAHLYADDIPDLLSEYDQAPLYRNTFAAIPDAVQFRPERTTPWPVVRGMLNAFVDGEAESEYAQLDDTGRYKVRLPFDEADKEKGDGKASHWLRMSSPYGGENFGFHFPLHKGTEVVLSFENGDPDRPFIVGMMQNPQAPGVLKGGTQRRAGFKSAGGNLLGINDVKGHEYCQIAAAGGSTMLLGNDGGARAELTADNVSASANQALYYAGLGWSTVFGLLYNEISAGGMYLTPIITKIAKEAIKGNEKFYKRDEKTGERNPDEKSAADKAIEKWIKGKQSSHHWKAQRYSAPDAKVKGEQEKAKFLAKEKSRILAMCASQCTRKAKPCLSTYQMDACDWARTELNRVLGEEEGKNESTLSPDYWTKQSYSDEDAKTKAKQFSKGDTSWPAPIPELSIPVEKMIDAALKTAITLAVKKLHLLYEKKMLKKRVKEESWKKQLKKEAMKFIESNPILGPLYFTGLNTYNAFKDGGWDKEPGVILSRDALTRESKVSLLRGGNNILLTTNSGTVQMTAPKLDMQASAPLFNPPTTERKNGFITLTYDAKFKYAHRANAEAEGTCLAASAEKFQLDTKESILQSEELIGVTAPKLVCAAKKTDVATFCSVTCDANRGMDVFSFASPFRVHTRFDPKSIRIDCANNGLFLQCIDTPNPDEYGEIAEGDGGDYHRAGLKLADKTATVVANNVDVRTNKYTLLADTSVHVKTKDYTHVATNNCHLHADREFKITCKANKVTIAAGVSIINEIINLGGQQPQNPEVNLTRSQTADWKPTQ